MQRPSHHARDARSRLPRLGHVLEFGTLAAPLFRAGRHRERRSTSDPHRACEPIGGEARGANRLAALPRSRASAQSTWPPRAGAHAAPSGYRGEPSRAGVPRVIVGSMLCARNAAGVLTDAVGAGAAPHGRRPRRDLLPGLRGTRVRAAPLGSRSVPHGSSISGVMVRRLRNWWQRRRLERLEHDFGSLSKDEQAAVRANQQARGPVHQGSRLPPSSR
jgi:hypothetical protein